MTNPFYIDQNHPVRSLLRAAASDRDLTRADLDRLATADKNLPPGSSLGKYSRDVQDGATKVADLFRQGQQQAARNLADDTAARIAGRMTDAERGATYNDTDQESLDDLATRMFRY